MYLEENDADVELVKIKIPNNIHLGRPQKNRNDIDNKLISNEEKYNRCIESNCFLQLDINRQEIYYLRSAKVLRM